MATQPQQPIAADSQPAQPTRAIRRFQLRPYVRPHTGKVRHNPMARRDHIIRHPPLGMCLWKSPVQVCLLIPGIEPDKVDTTAVAQPFLDPDAAEAMLEEMQRKKAEDEGGDGGASASTSS